MAAAALISTPAGTAHAAAGPNPFTLGVASGDPWPDGFVIWTRLATMPLNRDGFGGMPDASFTVEWQVSRHADFRSTVRTGTTTTSRAQGYAVHVTLTGLRAGTEFFYRFRCNGHLSRTGGAVTAPALGSMPGHLTATEAERLIRAAGFAPVRLGGIDESIRMEVTGELHPFGGLDGTLPTTANVEQLRG
ncbi:PhoD-like phosphatase N-terminal domain-containing protein [Micrococcus porci]|uniref:PhoD-like phosphatase N-terminal domain-containing protein n=1 Tax=Micrococcus porci TaxID=2856555 RepID=UPI001CCB3779|nr:PhoD-like phosphatase N-terminal domain-containing protein [Micrococcus porci]UBH25399.1 PhoD-like phosphatase N-terminal domain-containing protein [Micrococcus porci]